MPDNFWVSLGRLFGLRPEADGTADSNDVAEDVSFLGKIASRLNDEYQEHIVTPVTEAFEDLGLPTLEDIRGDFDTYIVEPIVDTFQGSIIDPITSAMTALGLPTLEDIRGDFETYIIDPIVDTFQESIIDPIVLAVGSDWKDRFLGSFAYDFLEDAWDMIRTPIILKVNEFLNYFTGVLRS